MSETATISSSDSGGRPALDIADTVPFTRLPNLRLTAEPSSTTTHESFLLSDRFIYSTSPTRPAAAVYHVSTRNTRSGKPWQLAISHLLPSEARRLSSAAAAAPLIKYDDDLTLYTGERLAVPISIGQKPLLCIRGGGRGAGGSALPGTIVVEKTLGRSRTYKFWHMTPIRRPLTRAEEERMQALMHRRGYRTSDDWRRELLYTVQGGGGRDEMEWKDQRGVVVARETEGRQLVVAAGGNEAPLEASVRDLLVACWASRNFVQSTAESEATAP